MRVLVINPGGTSTKIAVFENEVELFKHSFIHSQEDLAPFAKVFLQVPYRKKLILDELKTRGFDLKDFAAVSGRGGLFKPIAGGTYEVNEAMIKDVKDEINGEHASNIGCALASEIAKEIGARAFVTDPVSVDELIDIARITGIKELEKTSWFHALNQKAVSREIAKSFNKSYEQCNFIVAHLGSGLSIVAHEKGKMIDGSGGRTDGPFSPERSGGLLTYPLVELCYSGQFTREEMVDKLSFTGGFYAYLGTKDMQEIEAKVLAGDKECSLIWGAFIYQVAKEIASYSASLKGKIDAIILTGGIAHSKLAVEQISSYVGFLAPIRVLAGELEMSALALGALRVLTGLEAAKEYK